MPKILNNERIGNQIFQNSNEWRSSPSLIIEFDPLEVIGYLIQKNKVDHNDISQDQSQTNKVSIPRRHSPEEKYFKIHEFVDIGK